MPSLAVAAWTLVCWVPSFAGAQDAQQGPPEAYVEEIERAVAAGRADDWATARRHFQAAQGIYPNARALRGIGIAASNLGDYLEAYRALTDALSVDVLPLTDAQRAQATTLRAEVAQHVTVFTMDHLPDRVVVFVDGREVALQTDGTLVVTAGLHVVSVRAEHGQPRRVDADLRVPGGGHEPLPVEMSLRQEPAAEPVPATMDPEPSSAEPGPDVQAQQGSPDPTSPPELIPAADNADRSFAPRVAGLASAGAGAASLVVGAIVFARGRSTIADFDDPAPNATWRQLEPLRDDGERQTRVGAALMLVGGAMAATGVVIALTVGRPGSADDTPDGRASRDSRATASVRVGFGGVRTEVSW